MKKLLAILCMVLAILGLCACEQSEPEEQGSTAANAGIYEYFEEQKEDGKSPIVLEKAVKQEIKDAFVEANKNEYSLCVEEITLRCYGAFNGVYVLFVDVASWGYWGVIGKEVIADVEFYYANSQRMKVYSNGAFYSLTSAYENGILSRENLLEVKATRSGS